MSQSVLVIEHEKWAGLARLGKHLDAANAQVTVVGPEEGVALPNNLQGFDGLIVLGGMPGPLDDDIAPWLKQTRELMVEALEHETPLLGICLGAQLLAVVAGNTVSESPTPEIGVHEFQLTDAGQNDPLLSGFDSSLLAMQWHFLEVSDLPPGVEPLAWSPRCANQAFRVGKNAWGLQFHPEADVINAIEWSQGAENKLAELGLTAEGIIEDTREKEATLDQLWSSLAYRWLELVDNTKTEKAA